MRSNVTWQWRRRRLEDRSFRRRSGRRSDRPQRRHRTAPLAILQPSGLAAPPLQPQRFVGRTSAMTNARRRRRRPRDPQRVLRLRKTVFRVWTTTGTSRLFSARCGSDLLGASGAGVQCEHFAGREGAVVQAHLVEYAVEWKARPAEIDRRCCGSRLTAWAEAGVCQARRVAVLAIDVETAHCGRSVRKNSNDVYPAVAKIGDVDG